MPPKADPISQQFGARLREVRIERGLRQIDVATRLGMSPGGYSSVERGYARMFVTDIERYARALGVDAAYLGRRLGLCGNNARVIRAAEMTDLMVQLEDEPPEIVDGVLQMLRVQLRLLRGRGHPNGPGVN